MLTTPASTTFQMISPAFLSTVIGRYMLAYSGGKGNTKATIHLPAWLSKKAFDMTCTSSLGGWTHNLTCYNQISNHSAVVESIRQGHVVNVRNILLTGQATICDRDEDGRSLLHVRVLRVVKKKGN